MGCALCKVAPTVSQGTSPTPPESTQQCGQPLPALSEITSRVVNPSPNESFSRRSIPSTENSINVLLLGESGVGKSTFINAFANYLSGDTFEQAQSKKPTLLLPVSFRLTVGDQFEERTISLGEKHSNEIHNQSGQSVTQQCRSYYFSISTQTRIQFIDTPGMGDPRGSEQDDSNIEHIISYINNLPHLNAICILLKPNESRSTILFRSCVTRLISFLGENIGANLVFCFTNTRSTFFSPGNTGPILKQALKDLSKNPIPFGKENTFCFDSEAFRYLIAKENGIQFDESQKEECKKSWTKSAEESTRLLIYITEQLQPYLQSNWKAIKHQ